MIEALICLVVAVSDGDTLKARCGEPGSYEQISVRLAEIDAPEKGQPFGNLSRLALGRLCFGTMASLQPVSKDRYGRTVARVKCRGKDASLEQVGSGMAWAFTRYLTDPEVRQLEERARQARVGLWTDDRPEAPWEYRAKKREGAEGVQR